MALAVVSGITPAARAAPSAVVPSLSAAAPIAADPGEGDAPTTGDAAMDAESSARDDYRRQLKRAQLALIDELSAEEMRERAERLRLAVRASARIARASRRGGPRAAAGAASPRRLVPVPPTPLDRAGAADLDASLALAPNRRANDRFSDRLAFATQSEVAIAGDGTRVVAAWNDGETVGGSGPIGWGYSSDGGATWIDGGSLPVTESLPIWQSDPVLAVDERTGTFYLVALAISTHPLANALAVLRGSFADTGFVWEPPVAVRTPRDTLPDKPWLAVDPLRGDLYVSYTTFFRRGDERTDQIELQRSSDGGRTWAPPVKVTTPQDDGLVQGSRPAVGPAGELHVVWMLVDTLDIGGHDAMRVRTSRDGGRSFGPPATAGRFTTNFGSGGPGHNRGAGINFPGIAVDHSAGPHRGRVYVTWSSSLNFYDDLPGKLRTSKARVVFNDTDSAAVFSPGDVLRGQIGPSGAVVRYQFFARAGETITVFMDSLAARVDLSLRVNCPTTDARLAYSQPGGSGRRFLLFTAPVTGDYVVRLQTHNANGGAFRVQTGVADRGVEPGRDQRDVFVASSDDGRNWSPARRVNATDPRFDDWFPEVAVAEDGRVYFAWYSWREPNAGGCALVSDVLLARSDDGGASWSTLGAVTDRGSDWSNGSSNLIPNQGDYIALAANGADLHVAWADARSRDPDVFTARVAGAGSAILPAAGTRRIGLAVRGVRPNPSRGDVTLECALAPGDRGSLVVLDIAGRVVRRMALMPDAGGTATVTVAAGPDLPPGIYLARLEQSGRTAVRRFAIVH